MALGLVCQILQPRQKRSGETVYENIISENSLQLGAYRDGKYSTDRILETYRHNVAGIDRAVSYLIEHGIKSFRVSSSLFPLYDLAGEIGRSDPLILAWLRAVGQRIREAGIRVTTHPGQFTVLSSDRDSVVDNSIRELEYHAWIFDAMGLPQTPYAAINIHGGKRGRTEQLIHVIKNLPTTVRSRLTLENDEKCYNVRELLRVYEATGVPVVFDSHHFTFGEGDLTFQDAFHASMQTWGGVKPLQHLSNTEPGMENGSFNDRRAHSDMIHHVPPLQLSALRDDTVDVDVEAKMKNIAVLKMREDFNIHL